MFYLAPKKQPSTQAPVDWPQRYRTLASQAQAPVLRQFYEAGIVLPDTPLAKVPFVAVDFETTGLNPERHGIVSIGLIPFNLERIYCPQARHWILNPREPLVEKSVTYHGITHADIRRAPDLSEILDDFLCALAGRVPVVHYRAIERNFLNVALKLRLGEGIEFPAVDTMELEARLHRQRPRGWRLRKPKPVSIRLADSRKRYGLPYYQPHHALTDALASAELLQAQVAKHFSPTTLLSELWH